MPNRSVLGEMSLSANSLAPGSLPDFQQGINAQLKFFSDLQQMYLREQANARANAAAARAASLIGADGLTAWQRAQLEFNREKLKAQQEKSTAEKTVSLGIDPVTGEQITVQTNDKPSADSKKQMLNAELTRRMDEALANNKELQQLQGELASSAPMSVSLRDEKMKRARKILSDTAAQYGVEKSNAFQRMFGDTQAKLNEDRQQLKKASRLDSFWSGLQQGFNVLADIPTHLFRTPEESQQASAATQEKNRQLIMEDPRQRENYLQNQEAAQAGKERGFVDSTDFASLAGQTLGTLAPGIVVAPVAGMLGAPAAVATGIGAGLTGLLGAGLNQAALADRVNNDPNLTDQQKQEMLSYSNPEYLANTAVGAVAGSLIPGSTVNRAIRVAGSLAPAGSRVAQAGARAVARAGAARSGGQLVRDIATNAAENAAIMGGNTLATNALYNSASGQDNPITEGLGEAMAEGAVLGLPFGYLHYRGRPRPSAAEKPASGIVTDASHPVTIGGTDYAVYSENDIQYGRFVDKNGAAGWRVLTVDDQGNQKALSLNSKKGKALAKGMTAEQLEKKYNAQIARDVNGEGIQPGNEGESGPASNVEQSEPTGEAAGANGANNNDSPLATDPTADTGNAPDGTPLPPDQNNPAAQGGGDGGESPSGVRPVETNTANAQGVGVQQPEAADAGRDTPSPRPGSEQPGDGAGESTDTSGRSDGGELNAAADSADAQPADQPVRLPSIIRKSDANGDSITIDGVEFVRKGNKTWYVRANDGKRYAASVSKASDILPQRIKDIPAKQRNAEISRLFTMEEANGTNPKGEDVREQRGWHGSGADFDEFNLDYTGSGEGGAVHGYGVYVALDEASPYDTERTSHTTGEETAKKYRNIAQYRATIRERKKARSTYRIGNDIWERDTSTGIRYYVNRRTGERITDSPYSRFRVTPSNQYLFEALSALQHQDGVKRHALMEIDGRLSEAVATLRSLDDSSSDAIVTEHLNRVQALQAARDLISKNYYEPEISTPTGKIYRVDVPDRDVLLHEDLPFNEQPEKVQTALKKAVSTLKEQGRFGPDENLNNDIQDNSTGRQIYNTLAWDLGSQEEASYLLNQHGIEGIYAFGHRDGPIAVVFNDKAVQILNKYQRERLMRNDSSYRAVDKYFVTPEEKAVAANINTPGNVRRAAEIILSKLPGIKKAYVREVSDASYIGAYNTRTGEISVNPERINTAADSINNMHHELLHGTEREQASPSVRRFANDAAYANADEVTRARYRELYGADKENHYIGEEILADQTDFSIDAPQAEMRGAVLDIYGANAVTNGHQQVAAALRFFAQNADSGTFAGVAKATILSSESHTRMFVSGDPEAIANPLAQKLVDDYQNATALANVPRNRETLGMYLDAVLDPRTELDVFERQSPLC